MSAPDRSAGPTRHKTWVDRELYRTFQAQLQRRCHLGSYIIYDIVREGARAALAGIALPPGKERTNQPPMPSNPAEITWTQGAAEYEQRKAAINAAGSSLRAVITAGVRAYTEDPRLVLPPYWTPFPLPMSSTNRD